MDQANVQLAEVLDPGIGGPAISNDYVDILEAAYRDQRGLIELSAVDQQAYAPGAADESSLHLRIGDIGFHNTAVQRQGLAADKCDIGVELRYRSNRQGANKGAGSATELSADGNNGMVRCVGVREQAYGIGDQREISVGPQCRYCFERRC